MMRPSGWHRACLSCRYVFTQGGTMRTHKYLAALAVATSVVLGAPVLRATTRDDDDQAERIQDSIKVLQALTGAPDDRIPDHLLARAEAIVVIPSLIKGGFVVGG